MALRLDARNEDFERAFTKLLGRKREELDRPEFERALAELGSEGWELATVFLDVNLHREKDGHVLVFKRRVED